MRLSSPSIRETRHRRKRGLWGANALTPINGRGYNSLARFWHVVFGHLRRS